MTDSATTKPDKLVINFDVVSTIPASKDYENVGSTSRSVWDSTIGLIPGQKSTEKDKNKTVESHTNEMITAQIAKLKEARAGLSKALDVADSENPIHIQLAGKEIGADLNQLTVPLYKDYSGTNAELGADVGGYTAGGWYGFIPYGETHVSALGKIDMKAASDSLGGDVSTMADLTTAFQIAAAKVNAQKSSAAFKAMDKENAAIVLNRIAVEEFTTQITPLLPQPKTQDKPVR